MDLVSWMTLLCKYKGEILFTYFEKHILWDIYPWPMTLTFDLKANYWFKIVKRIFLHTFGIMDQIFGHI